MIEQRVFDGKFIEFPLCCLIYVGGEKERLKDIAVFFLFESAYQLNTKKNINEKFREVSTKYNYQIEDFEIGVRKYMLIKGLVLTHIEKHGAEPYCRIGNELLFETIAGKFQFAHFTFLCALSAIMGKRNAYKKISKKRLSYCMIGYKSSYVYEKDRKGKLEPVPERKIGNIADQLTTKKFFTKFTYNRRHTYYSTRIKSKKRLAELIMNAKLIKQAEKLKLEDARLTAEINNMLEKQKNNHYKIIKLKKKELSRSGVGVM